MKKIISFALTLVIMVVLYTFPVSASTSSIDAAIAWADSQVGKATFDLVGGGSVSSYFYCTKFVANAYGSTSAGVKDAISLWNQSVQHANDWNAPRGSLVFFRANTKNGNYGHVALCTGNGNLIEAGYSKVQTSTITKENGIASYLGWAWPPSRWPGRSGSGSPQKQSPPEVYTITAYSLDYAICDARLTLDSGIVIYGTKLSDSATGYSFLLKGKTNVTVPPDFVVTCGKETEIRSGNASIVSEGGQTFVRAGAGSQLIVDSWAVFWEEKSTQKSTNSIAAYSLDYAIRDARLTLNSGIVIYGTKLSDSETGYSFLLKGKTHITVPPDFVVTCGKETEIRSGNASIVSEGGQTFVRAGAGSQLIVDSWAVFWHEPIAQNRQ